MLRFLKSGQIWDVLASVSVGFKIGGSWFLILIRCQDDRERPVYKPLNNGLGSSRIFWFLYFVGMNCLCSNPTCGCGESVRVCTVPGSHEL
jgi:hypothetical protein